MKVEVVGKNGFNPSDANKEYAINKLKKLDKLVPDSENVNARVVFKVYKQFHKVEFTIPTKNIILRAEVSEQDIYAAVDTGIDKLVSQITRYNDKVKDKMGKHGIRQIDEAPAPRSEKIVRDKKVDLEPMTADEAMDQMELLGHDFYIYLDKHTRKTNVIYLREDGNYAIIEANQK